MSAAVLQMSAEGGQPTQPEPVCIVRYNATIAGMSRQQYDRLHEAFEFFNARLFGGKLPPVIFALSRHRGARGYFAPERWAERAEGTVYNAITSDLKLDEIALCPEAFEGRTDREILSTLVHEMCHLERQHTGQPPRGGYHDREWGRMMKAVGLHPSNTGAEGGKETGQQMTHYIIEGGPFEVAVQEFLDNGRVVFWQGLVNMKPKRAKDKFKYECAGCQQKAWAKAGARLACGDCGCIMACDDPEAEA